MRYTDGLMESLRYVGDPELDPIMEELVQGKGLEGVNAALRSALTNATAAPSTLPPRLGAWLTRAARLPEGTDLARLDRASAFFVDHGVSLAAILGLASLPECYAAKKGVKALHATDQMGYSGTEKRVSETSQFVLQVMAPGGFHEGGAAIATLMKVRMMHSASRLLIQAKDWDTKADGLPVNQEDLIGTLTTFGCTPLLHIQKLGVKVTPEIAEDFWYFWRVAGEMLGIDKDNMPRDAAEAKVYFDRVQERHRGKSNEGIELTRSLLQLYARIVPGAKLLDGLVPGVMRFLAGDDVADALEVPKSRWTGFIKDSRIVFRWLNAAQESSEGVNNFINRFGLKILSQETIRIGGGRAAEFAIPAELRRAWRLPPYGSEARTGHVIRELTGEVQARIASKGDGGTAEAALDAVIDLVVLVANADREIDPLEEAALTDTIVALAPRHAENPTKRIRTSVKSAKKAGLDASVETVTHALTTSGVIEEGLCLAIAMAYANSGIASEERVLIEKLALAADVPHERLEELVQITRARIESAPVM